MKTGEKRVRKKIKIDLPKKSPNFGFWACMKHKRAALKLHLIWRKIRLIVVKLFFSHPHAH